MIRLPPTSISLSENDLSFHLQQIDIYQGLLKQGFKKKDILRYFQEHNAAQQPNPSPNVDLGPPSLTGVQLAARASRSLAAPTKSSKPQPKTQNAEQSAAVPDSPAKEPNPSCVDDGVAFPTSTSPILQSSLQGQRHAPRQSSLLRFTRVASSSSSNRTELANSHLNLPARTYRPRTDTYSYNQSEISESEMVERVSGLHLTSSTHNATVPNNSVPPSWAEAAVFVPGRLSPWTSRVSSSCTSREILYPSQMSISRQASRETDLIEPMTPRLVSLDETLRRANVDYQNTTRANIASSPPGDDYPTSTEAVRSHVYSSPRLPSMPGTPTPVHPRDRNVHTEPRRVQHQYLDGSSFPVYNDAIPADAQPQTPADLARRPPLTQQDAAYTAPPGVLHTGSPVRRTRRSVPESNPEDGEQTPMARAVGSRERRARELMRSVRVEGARLRRLRQQDRETVARGLGENDEVGHGDGPGPAVELDLWREELAGDRVGDENWGEEDWTPRGERMRVASGNARDLW